MAGSGNSGVKLRVVSALALMSPTIAAAWFGSPWLPMVVAAAAAGMGIEWARLVDDGPEQRRALIVATPLAAAVLAAFAYPAAACAVAVMGAAAVAALAGRATVLWLLVLVWSVDVAAYVVGRVVGG